MTTRDQEQIARVAKMDWDELEDSLASSATRAGAKTEDDQALEKFFGPEELEELKRIAAQTRAMRTRAPLLGNVVLLPGIMGSNLAATSGNDVDLIWVHLFRLVGGGVKRLRLSPDGSTDIGGAPVHASEVEKRTYTKAVLKLGGRWRVHPFPYDWRRNIDTASNALEAFVRGLRAKFPGEPINLVAHSLGGLVSRNFIRLHGDLWEEIRGDDTGGRGGRLIMLGTPNYGSFAIHQAMAGIEKLVRWLEKADLKHDMREVLEVLNSFVGSYQLLPAPGKIPAEVREIYKAGSWGMLPISQAHLDTAQAFHRNLESNETTIDPRRMIYVAGCNQETLLSLIIQGPGEFRYVTTHQGDGRVPFTLGLLKDVPTYYVEEGHGSLPKNDSVLKAVDQLLERGRTDVLPDKPIPPRAFFVPEAPWHRSVGEYLIESALEKIAQQAEVERADSDEVRFAEEMLTRAAAGDNRPARQPGQRRTATARPVSAGPRNPLTVEVVHGDVRQVAAPVVVVGSYKGLVPVSAIGAIDQALDYWISQAMQQSMLGAELGQVFFIPIRRKQIAAGSVLVAGMGEEGKFSRHDLRYLMLNVTYAISALEADSFATVLLGTGDGGLSPETAVRSLLFGVCDALARAENGIERLIIVEYDGPRAKKIAGILETVKSEDSAAGLDIR
ncbi:MAG TPA: M17 family peptidase N-terminal domain-containing protein, partial [Thermoanaerobaculia bacterium]